MKYRHGVPLAIYALIYLVWFWHLEEAITTRYQVIHVSLDDLIPFCEVFVVPYFLWFAYVIATVAYFFLKDRDDYFKMFILLSTGMTVFLMISTLFPNGHHLRPLTMPRNNIFTHMVAALYRTDTPTNLWPSIHVYNSLGCHIAITRSDKIKNAKYGTAIRIASFILCVSIIMSTMFIKQHSVFDVATAFIMAAVMYGIVYRSDVLVQLNIKNLRHSL